MYGTAQKLSIFNIQNSKFLNEFQIGLLSDGNLITNAIEINKKIMVIKRNGEFGQLNFDEHGGCSFVHLSNSKFSSEFLGIRYLHQN